MSSVEPSWGHLKTVLPPQRAISSSLRSICRRRTTGALEAAYVQAFTKEISLSEQQLVECAGAFNNFGFQGGLPSQAFEYIKYKGGLDTEESYPYTGKNDICKFSPENVGVKVIDSINITLGTETELKYAVALIRPISVAFEVLDDFRQHKSGVYTSTKCGSTPMDVNHAVFVVGYDVKNGVPYWLIKNSWERNGVTMDTSKWRWERTCVVLQLAHPSQL